MIPLFLACSAPPPPPDVDVSVEVVWPGVDVSAVERGVLQPLESALAPLDGLKHLRCEAIAGAGRCVATLPEADLGTVRAAAQDLHATLPPDAERPLVVRMPDVLREARWLVLTGPSAELDAWDPQTAVLNRWDARCDGQPALALELLAEPPVPPPASVSARTRILGTDRVHLTGPDASALDRVDAALDGSTRCLTAARGRLDGWVLAAPADVRARLAGLNVDVVPAEATHRRFVTTEGDGADLAEQVRGLDGVLTVRALIPRTEPTLDVRIDPDRAAQLGVTQADVARAVEAFEGLQEVRIPTPKGEVRLMDVASVTRDDSSVVLVRVDRQRAALLDVILSEDTPAARATVDAALSRATPLDDWVRNLQRP